MAKYLIRLDDACPTQDYAKWLRIEKLLDKYNIKPIVAIIPNNKDKNLQRAPLDTKFWIPLILFLSLVMSDPGDGVMITDAVRGSVFDSFKNNGLSSTFGKDISTYSW